MKNLNGVAQQQKTNNSFRQLWKPIVDTWITNIIDKDIKRGMTQDNFATPGMYDFVRSAVPHLNKMGFDVYQGGGNVFHVKYDNIGPLIIQAKPLAQRVIRLKV